MSIQNSSGFSSTNGGWQNQQAYLDILDDCNDEIKNALANGFAQITDDLLRNQDTFKGNGAEFAAFLDESVRSLQQTVKEKFLGLQKDVRRARGIPEESISDKFERRLSKILGQAHENYGAFKEMLSKSALSTPTPSRTSQGQSSRPSQSLSKNAESTQSGSRQSGSKDASSLASQNERMTRSSNDITQKSGTSVSKSAQPSSATGTRSRLSLLQFPSKSSSATAGQASKNESGVTQSAGTGRSLGTQSSVAPSSRQLTGKTTSTNPSAKGSFSQKSVPSNPKSASLSELSSKRKPAGSAGTMLETTPFTDEESDQSDSGSEGSRGLDDPLSAKFSPANVIGEEQDDEADIEPQASIQRSSIAKSSAISSKPPQSIQGSNATGSVVKNQQSSVGSAKSRKTVDNLQFGQDILSQLSSQARSGSKKSMQSTKKSVSRDSASAAQSTVPSQLSAPSVSARSTSIKDPSEKSTRSQLNSMLISQPFMSYRSSSMKGDPVGSQTSTGALESRLSQASKKKLDDLVSSASEGDEDDLVSTDERTTDEDDLSLAVSRGVGQ